MKRYWKLIFCISIVGILATIYALNQKPTQYVKPDEVLIRVSLDADEIEPTISPEELKEIEDWILNVDGSRKNYRFDYGFTNEEYKQAIRLFVLAQNSYDFEALDKVSKVFLPSVYSQVKQIMLDVENEHEEPPYTQLSVKSYDRTEELIIKGEVYDELNLASIPVYVKLDRLGQIIKIYIEE